VKKAKDVAKEGPLTHLFKGYDLKALQVPQDAWPLENGVYKGTKSYTVRSRSGAVPCHLV